MSGPNTSHAILTQRHAPRDDADFCPTPPWGTRAFLEIILGGRAALKRQSVWEPACGQGHMARPLAEYFRTVYASDKYRYGWGDIVDFLDPAARFAKFAFDWIVSNPPFAGREIEFILRALKLARNVAMLVRVQVLEGVDRFARLFWQTPPNMVVTYAERLPIVTGRVDPNGNKPMMFAWLVWTGRRRTEGEPYAGHIIPPCHRSFERPGDYDLPEDPAARREFLDFLANAHQREAERIRKVLKETLN